MDLWQRHRVRESGEGPITLLFVHGLGTRQEVWRHLEGPLARRNRVVLYDLAGCGRADPSLWSAERYRTLEGHAQDLLEIAERLRDSRVVLVVHSVGAMIGLLAELQAPHLFDAHVMVSPSPCYLNLPGYAGGFDRQAIDALLQAIETDEPGWHERLAADMVREEPPGPFAAELAAALRAAQPQALCQFARATFLADHREQLRRLVKPVLVIQGPDDPVVPQPVGRAMLDLLPSGRLELLKAPGHFPQWTEPQACVDAIGRFLDGLGFRTI